ncbi:MAG: J domain-containing protein [Verrucomicrobiota bacterium]
MNAYHVFDLPEKPLVDPDALKQRLHDLSKRHHPQQETEESERWGEIHSAYQILADEVKRLKHLLECNGLSDPNHSAAVPEEVMGLFATVGPALHRADGLIARMDAAESVLEKAILQHEVLMLAMELQGIAGQVGDFRARLQEQIQLLDTGWEDAADPESLHAIYRQLVYVARWAGQLDEKQFRMMNF